MDRHLLYRHHPAGASLMPVVHLPMYSRTFAAFAHGHFNQPSQPVSGTPNMADFADSAGSLTLVVGRRPMIAVIWGRLRSESESWLDLFAYTLLAKSITGPGPVCFNRSH
jgi:hypothetical protein